MNSKKPRQGELFEFADDVKDDERSQPAPLAQSKKKPSLRPVGSADRQSNLVCPASSATRRAKLPAKQPNFLAVGQVAKRYGVGISTIWRWAADSGPFPAPVKLTKGTTRWRFEDLEAYDQQLCASKRVIANTNRD